MEKLMLAVNAVWLLLLAILNVPIHWIACLVPKKNDLWLFSCRQGVAYAENSKYLFEYVHANSGELSISAVWLTKSREVYKTLQARNLPVVMAYSPKGYWLSMRCGFLFFSNFRRANADYNDYAVGGGTIRFQLWHGSPMKRIGHSKEVDNGWALSTMIRIIVSIAFPFYRYRTGCHYMLAASDVVERTFLQAFQLATKNVVVSGYPKNDAWLQRVRGMSEEPKKRRMIYLPTWRLEDQCLFTDYGFDVEALNDSLASSNLVLDIKLHHYSRDKVLQLYPNIAAATNINFVVEDDVYEILDRYHLLITDYSSILFDYLLCGRPVIFAPFDFEQYSARDVGFLFDYNDQLTPGPKIQNWSQLSSEAENILKDDQYQNARDDLMHKFNHYTGNDSCRRLIGIIQSLENGNDKPSVMVVH